MDDALRRNAPQVTALAILGALTACDMASTLDAPPAESRRLGMNDVTMLLPLPADPAAPILLTLAGDSIELVNRGLFTALVLAGEDIAPKLGGPVTFEGFHVVALRIDLCDRAIVGVCRDGDDGRLRLVLQPMYLAQGVTTAHDIAIHAFYPIPAAELPDVVRELRALARLQDTPLDAALTVSPALSAPDRSAEYAGRLRALVTTYARRDRLLRLTVLGQDARSAAFAWVLKGFERQDDGTYQKIVIPTLGPERIEQTALISGGDTVFNVRPVADSPPGFATAINGATFATASSDERAAALAALTAIQNPLKRGTTDTQCVGCHVATFLTARRAKVAGVDPLTVPGRYASTYNLAVDGITVQDARVLRNLGWAATFPAISQRVVNETAQVLTEIELRFPP